MQDRSALVSNARKSILKGSKSFAAASHLFDRETLEHAGAVAGRTVANTDGIWLHAVGTKAFPNGVLYVSHNDEGAGAFDWRAIAKALDLRADCTAP
mgnify:CR=1 FL=1